MEQNKFQIIFPLTFDLLYLKSQNMNQIFFISHLKLGMLSLNEE